MRYYNENPQITLWKNRTIKAETDLAFAKYYNSIIVESLNKLTEEIEVYNSLPWYKKMFYKFKL